MFAYVLQSIFPGQSNFQYNWGEKELVAVRHSERRAKEISNIVVGTELPKKRKNYYMHGSSSCHVNLKQCEEIQVHIR